MRKIVFVFLKVTLWMLPIAFLMFVIMIDGAYTISVIRGVNQVARLIYLPIPLFLTLSFVPFFYTIIMAFRLLIILEQKEQTDYSYLLLSNIEKGTLYYAISMTLTLPFVYLFVEMDDSPGFLLLFIILSFAGYVLSAFAYVLKELFLEKKLMK